MLKQFAAKTSCRATKRDNSQEADCEELEPVAWSSRVFKSLAFARRASRESARAAALPLRPPFEHEIAGKPQGPAKMVDAGRTDARGAGRGPCAAGAMPHSGERLRPGRRAQAATHRSER